MKTKTDIVTVDGKFLTKRKLPTWRLMLIMGLVFSIATLVLFIPDIINARPYGELSEGANKLLLISVAIYSGFNTLLFVLLLWRIVIIFKEAIYQWRNPPPMIEYVDNDAIKVMRQNIHDPVLMNLSDNELLLYVTEASSEHNFSQSTRGNRFQDTNKLRKSLKSNGIDITEKQLFELIDAESVYMKQIGIM